MPVVYGSADGRDNGITAEDVECWWRRWRCGVRGACGDAGLNGQVLADSKHRSTVTCLRNDHPGQPRKEVVLLILVWRVRSLAFSRIEIATVTHPDSEEQVLEDCATVLLRRLAQDLQDLVVFWETR